MLICVNSTYSICSRIRKTELPKESIMVLQGISIGYPAKKGRPRGGMIFRFQRNLSVFGFLRSLRDKVGAADIYCQIICQNQKEARGFFESAERKRSHAS